jgi:hypothetical protein
MVMSPNGLGPEKDYAGEGQQHIRKTTPSSCQRRRPTKTRPYLSKSNKYLVMSPTWGSTLRLTDWLTVNCNVTLTLLEAVEYILGQRTEWLKTTWQEDSTVNWSDIFCVMNPFPENGQYVVSNSAVALYYLYLWLISRKMLINPVILSRNRYIRHVHPPTYDVIIILPSTSRSSKCTSLWLWNCCVLEWFLWSEEPQNSVVSDWHFKVSHPV